MQGVTQTIYPVPRVCQLGITIAELRKMFTEDEFVEFGNFMRGQTLGFCTGTRYNHDTEQEEFTECGPHGSVAYQWDVERFLKGLPVID